MGEQQKKKNRLVSAPVQSGRRPRDMTATGHKLIMQGTARI